MATMQATRIAIAPGRRADALAVLKAHRAFLEGHGSVVQFRTWLVAGENTGAISMYQFFPDAMARARVLDAVRADGGRSPMVAMQNDASPAFSVFNRSWAQTIDPAEPVPSDFEVVNNWSYELNPQLEADALAALEESQARHRSLGANRTTWITTNAGGTSLRRVVSLGFGSYVEMQEFTARNAAAPGQFPLQRAQRSGALRAAAQVIMVRVAVS